MMRGSITFYPKADHTPTGNLNGGVGHLYLNQYDEPSLLINPGDQAYLRGLAAAATELADAMDAHATESDR